VRALEPVVAVGRHPGAALIGAPVVVRARVAVVARRRLRRGLARPAHARLLRALVGLARRQTRRRAHAQLDVADVALDLAALVARVEAVGEDELDRALLLARPRRGAGDLDQ